MTPVEQAAAVYNTEPCARSFREDLEAHLLHGYVFSTPEFFAMGRAVDSHARAGLIVNPWVKFDTSDAWMIYLVAGDTAKAIEALPYDLPLICWERSNSLRFWRTARVKMALARKSSRN